MFTGLIEEVGVVDSAQVEGGACRLCIRAALSRNLVPGQSIAVNGVCQTVMDCSEESFSVVAVEETLRKTTMGRLSAGIPVNLERAMRLSSRLDGHLVQGHVDTTGDIIAVHEEGVEKLFRVQFDQQYACHVIPVGSIALDGISLTVAGVHATYLSVVIIPHTYAHTNVCTWQCGRKVNIEFDLIGKYVARLLEHWRAE